MLLTTGLVALIRASAALATPLIAEPILFTGLEVRHSDLESRQSSRVCLPSYTSKNGLNFTTYCDQNNPLNDAREPFPATTMDECIEKCSRFWGKGEGCFGVVWSRSSQCWLRNSTTSTSTLKPSKGDHSAYVNLEQMKPLDTACPGNDLEVKTLDNGIKYAVNCNKDILSFNTHWEGYTYSDNPFQAFYHATSLEECVGFCVQEHPLCLAAIYNPDLSLGFANCWPKTGSPGTLPAPGKNRGTIHAATIRDIGSPDKSCPKEPLHVSQNNKAFDIHCGQLNTGSNITDFHTENLTSCIDACATSDRGCIGIVFDSTLHYGYSNCYLQNSSLVISDKPSVTYAALSKSSLPSGAPAPPPSHSQAWIAAPVVGGVAALALIGFGLFWWRRRKNRAALAAAAAANSEIVEKNTGHGPAYYAHNASPGDGYHAVAPAEIGAGDEQIHELAGSGTKGGTDATAMMAKREKGPQELPS